MTEAFRQLRRRSQPLPVKDLLFEVDPTESKRSSATFSIVSTISVRKPPSFGNFSWWTGKSVPASPIIPETPKTIRLPQSYSFSADGKMLLLWTRGDECVYASTIPTGNAVLPDNSSKWNWYKYEVLGGVGKVAGGEGRVAAISEAYLRGESPQDRRLLIFNTSDNTPTLSKPISRRGVIECIAMSRNGDFVSLALGRTVLIYNLRDAEHTSTPARYTLPFAVEPHPGYQTMSFSSDGTEVITATLEMSGQVNISLCDCNGKRTWSKKVASANSMVRASPIAAFSI
jgi:hypothetical protein